MITTDATSFYVIKLMDEVAQAAVSLYAPQVAVDIREISITSDDFQSDIEAVTHLDAAIKQLTSELPELEVDETFNPLFTSRPIEEVDDLIQMEPTSNGYSFTGFNGNPYIFKNVRIGSVETPVLIGRVQYHPFELPAYSDVAKLKTSFQLN